MPCALTTSPSQTDAAVRFRSAVAAEARQVEHCPEQSHGWLYACGCQMAALCRMAGAEAEPCRMIHQ